MNNLYLIIGEDEKIVNFNLYNILDKIDYVDDNKIIYDHSVDSLTSVIDEASMMSLNGLLKVIIFNNFDLSKIDSNEIDYLSRYINSKNKDAYIIIVAKKIDGRKKEYKIFKDNFNIINTVLDNDNKSKIRDYIDNYIKSKGYKIDSINLDYLVSKLGIDINNINLECDKLMLYKNDNKYIDRQTIDLLISDNIDNIIYEFTNAIIERDNDKIVKMYNDFKTMNIGYDYLLVSIANYFRQLLIIKMLYNDGKSNIEISKVIGKKEFYVKKTLERLYNYTEDDLKSKISQLGKIDIDFKIGNSKIDMLLLFLVKS
ncbi:MAG: DNA polymerase III subunit delta [Bacilli bacterium]|nr:DNA polymerase III subunit delta [Bacilli bacterium]